MQDRIEVSPCARMVEAAGRCFNELDEIKNALRAYIAAVNKDGTDSLEAQDWLALITRKEMCIQQFTNAIADIEGEDL